MLLTQLFSLRHKPCRPCVRGSHPSRSAKDGAPFFVVTSTKIKSPGHPARVGIHGPENGVPVRDAPIFVACRPRSKVDSPSVRADPPSRKERGKGGATTSRVLRRIGWASPPPAFLGNRIGPYKCLPLAGSLPPTGGYAKPPYGCTAKNTQGIN